MIEESVHDTETSSEAQIVDLQEESDKILRNISDWDVGDYVAVKR